MNNDLTYRKNFLPYALAAFLVGIVGGFSAVLGPAFVQDIGIAYNNTTWTTLAQAMSTAACAPILGKLGDILGKKSTLLLGILIYMLGNILTALANSLVFMMLARFIIGIGSAAIAPVILAYIATEFPPQAMAKGFSLYMLISSSSVVFGPTLGGLIINRYGWRIMVLICVLICLAVLTACFFLSKKTPSIPTKQQMKNFDVLGAFLVFFCFSSILCIPAFGQNIGWNSLPFFLVIILALLTLITLIFTEKKALNPILPLAFMKRKTFIFSILALFLTQGLLQANMTNIIVFVNYTQPENAVISGYAISLMYLGMALGALLVGPLADRFEPKFVLSFSLMTTAFGCSCLFLFSVHTPLLLLMSALGILGFGLGGNATIFMKIVLSGVSAQDAGTGTGTYGLFRDLAAPFGVAVFVPMFTNSITSQIQRQIAAPQAAVQAIHNLAFIELLCVIGGIIVVLLLPKIHQK